MRPRKPEGAAQAARGHLHPDGPRRPSTQQTTPARRRDQTIRKDRPMSPSNDQTPLAVVERFLQAMSRLDVDGMFAEQAPDVVCVFPTAPGGPQEIRGWETNRTF